MVRTEPNPAGCGADIDLLTGHTVGLVGLPAAADTARQPCADVQLVAVTAGDLDPRAARERVVDVLAGPDHLHPHERLVRDRVTRLCRREMRREVTEGH